MLCGFSYYAQILKEKCAFFNEDNRLINAGILQMVV